MRRFSTCAGALLNCLLMQVYLIAMVRAVKDIPPDDIPTMNRPPDNEPSWIPNLFYSPYTCEKNFPSEFTPEIRSSWFSTGTLTLSSRINPLSIPLHPFFGPQSPISTPGSNLWVFLSRIGTM